MQRSAAVLWGLLVAAALPPVVSAQQSCPFSTGGLILSSNPAQVGALQADGVPDTCGATGACAAQGVQPIHYAIHTLVNNNTTDPTCVTAKLTALCGVPGVTELYLAAYSPAFNPASICQNLVGSSGVTAINSQVSTSFRVPAGAQFQLVVSVVPGGQCEYTLTATGCGLGDPQPPPPVPALSAAGLAALFLGLAAYGWWRLRRRAVTSPRSAPSTPATPPPPARSTRAPA